MIGRIWKPSQWHPRGRKHEGDESIAGVHGVGLDLSSIDTIRLLTERFDLEVDSVGQNHRTGFVR